MSFSQASLPDFDSPPVGEVALSVQFNKLSSLQIPHFGILWQVLRERFPITQTHSPITQTADVLGGRPTGNAGIRIEIVSEPIHPRVWFITQSGNELLQIQNDRFVFNWRKVADSDVYPRYEYVRSRFVEELQVFKQFLLTEKLGELKATQCEVTYVNQILPSTVWANHGQIGKVFSPWREDFTDPDLPECEVTRIAQQYILERADSSGKTQIGRLIVEIQPGVRITDNQPIFAMNLTARGIPLSDSSDGVLSFMDLGREHIVKGFRALTSKQMHKEWGLHE